MGGGLNVALNMINALPSTGFLLDDFIIIVRRDNDIAKEAMINLGYSKDNIVFIPAGIVVRFLFRLCYLPVYLRLRNVRFYYSLFGFHISSLGFKYTAGCAVSNIFYPEVVFWDGLNGVELVKKRLIDIYRKYTLVIPSKVFVENRHIKQRASNLPFLRGSKFIFSAPSCDSRESLFTREEVNKDTLMLLYVGGWQMNKGVLDLPEILYNIISNEGQKVICNMTLEPSGNYYELFWARIKLYGLEDNVHFHGILGKDELSLLYRNSDFVFLLSKLESFSNIITESRLYSCLLVGYESEWLRSECLDSILYVSKDFSRCAKEIVSIYTNGNEYQRKLNRSKELLRSMPSHVEKIRQDINLIIGTHD